jgi:hypothetical protein
VLRWRQGLSASSTAERLCLMYAEQRAISEAAQLAYQERLNNQGSVLVDALDLEPTSCSVKWARKAKHLYVHCTVRIRKTGSSYTFNWRVNPEKLAPVLLRTSTEYRRQHSLR